MSNIILPVNETGYFENSEWKEDKLGCFSASEIHKLFVSAKSGGSMFGEGAMTYIFSKAAEILTGLFKEEYQFKATEWGHANEVDAKVMYEKVTRYQGEYFGSGNPKFFKKGKYAGCSPDWICDELKKGAQIKCHYNSAEHVKDLQIRNMADLKVKRKEYYHQVQMEMWVFNYASWDLVSYDPRMIEDKFKIKILTCTPDPEWLAEFGSRLANAVKGLEKIIFAEPVKLLHAENTF